MCVILVAEGQRLRASEIRDAHARNPDGIGIAWVRRGLVEWRKGLTVNQAIRVARTAPLPYVLHARYATVGRVGTDLCHPFPVTRSVPVAPAGRNRRVLFHNGTWRAWDAALDAAEDAGHQLPDGPWSDSRALAWLVAAQRVDLVSRFDHQLTRQRVALLDGRGVTRVGEWQRLRRGVYASNLRWQRRQEVA